MRWYHRTAWGRAVFCLIAVCLLGVVCLSATACYSNRSFILQEISDDLDQAVTAAILEHNQGLSKDSEFQTESHQMLGAEKQENTTIVYAMVLYREYGFRGDEFCLLGDTYKPVAMTFEQQSDGQYTLAEYWEPPAGEGYQSAIENKFPKPLFEKAINLQQYFDTQAWECEFEARQYLDSLES